MINKVILVGRLGKNPELKGVGNGQSVCKFSLATTEKWSGADGKAADRTEWHNIVVWGKTAEFCAQYLGKGRLVYVEGKIGSRSWDKDGTKIYITEITAQSVQFLDSAKSESQTTKQPAEYQSLNDIPF